VRKCCKQNSTHGQAPTRQITGYVNVGAGSRIGPDARHFIGSRRTEGFDGGVFEIVNPTIGAVLVEVARGRRRDLELAAASARQAFGGSGQRSIAYAGAN